MMFMIHLICTKPILKLDLEFKTIFLFCSDIIKQKNVRPYTLYTAPAIIWRTKVPNTTQLTQGSPRLLERTR